MPEALWVGEQEWIKPGEEAAVQPVWARAGTRERHPSGRWSVLTNPIDWARDRLIERGIVRGREWNQLSFPWPFPGDEPTGRGSYTSFSPWRWRADVKVTEREQTSHGKGWSLLLVCFGDRAYIVWREWSVSAWLELKDHSLQYHVSVPEEIWAWHLLV